MSLGADYLALGERLLAAFPDARITGLHLPQPVADESFRDEFGFVFLADGSIGPFYVSMGDLLVRLWRRHPDPVAWVMPAERVLAGFLTTDPPDRALALGVFNALSRSLFRAAGYLPPDRAGGSGVGDLSGDATVGMVGYFAPLVDRLTAAGTAVRVLEQVPQRVPERPLVSVVTRPSDLADCAQVLCTASVLINDTLDELLAACPHAGGFELVGPSGSGVPDALFARGVTRVGGIQFDDAQLLRDTLARGESWGRAGRKYQIAAADYPGLDRLIAVRA